MRSHTIVAILLSLLLTRVAWAADVEIVHPPYLSPGATAVVAVTAMEGDQAVAWRRVSISLDGEHLLGAGRTDSHGRAHVTIRVPADTAPAFHALDVDVAGEKKSIRMPVTWFAVLAMALDSSTAHPGQPVTARALVLERSSLEPLPGWSVACELVDEGGSVQAGAEGSTDEHGLAEVTTTLPTTAGEGVYQVSCAAGDDQVSRPVVVSTISTGAVSVTSPQPWIGAGEPLDVWVEATGAAGAQASLDVFLFARQEGELGDMPATVPDSLTAFDQGCLWCRYLARGRAWPLVRLAFVLDGEGRARVEVPELALPDGVRLDSRSWVGLRAQVGDGQGVTALPWAGDGPIVAARWSHPPVLGEPSRLMVTAQQPDGTPADARVAVHGDESIVEGETGPDGVALLDVQTGQGSLEIRAAADSGEASRSMQARQFSHTGVALVLPQPVVGDGQTLPVELRAAHAAYGTDLGLVVGGSLVSLQREDIPAGTSTVELDVPPGLTGPATVFLRQDRDWTHAAAMVVRGEVDVHAADAVAAWLPPVYERRVWPRTSWHHDRGRATSLAEQSALVRGALRVAGGDPTKRTWRVTRAGLRWGPLVLAALLVAGWLWRRSSAGWSHGIATAVLAATLAAVPWVWASGPRDRVFGFQPPEVMIRVGADAIRVGDEVVVEVVDGAVSELHKRGTFITPLYDHLQPLVDERKAEAARYPPQRPFRGSAGLEVEPDVAFSLLREVMYTAGQARFGDFSFLSPDELQVKTPDRRGPSAAPWAWLALLAWVAVLAVAQRAGPATWAVVVLAGICGLLQVLSRTHPVMAGVGIGVWAFPLERVVFRLHLLCWVAALGAIAWEVVRARRAPPMALSLCALGLAVMATVLAPDVRGHSLEPLLLPGGSPVPRLALPTRSSTSSQVELRANRHDGGPLFVDAPFLAQDAALTAVEPGALRASRVGYEDVVAGALATTPDGVAGLPGEDEPDAAERSWTEARVEDRSGERSFLLEHQPPARRWQPQGQGRVHELRPPAWNVGSDILIGIWGERTQWQEPGPYDPGLAAGLLEEMPPLPKPLSLDSALGILIGTTGSDSGGDDIADLLDDTPTRASDTLAGEETE